MSIVACTPSAPARQRRPLWRASSAGGSSSARRRCSSRSTGGTTRATRRWWCCRAIRAFRSASFPAPPSAWPTSASARPTRAGRSWPAVQVSRSSSSPIPDWPDNVRVDMRDQRWQDRPAARGDAAADALGFDGVMLDTIDTAPYLENKDPARFAGSRQALRDWLRRLRETLPARGRHRERRRGAGRRRAVRRRLRRRGGVLDLRPRPARSTAPRPTPNAPGSWARSRARGRRAAAGVLDRIRRRRRRRAVTLGRQDDRSDTGFGPTSGSAISTPRPDDPIHAGAIVACIFQFFLNI